MHYNVQVLFLHNLTPQNEFATYQNFESFKKHGNDILGICDEDQRGLDNSFYVPLNSYIPRGSRRWNTERIILNYALINRDKLYHSHYMFCEYDCYTECNINKLCEPYKNYDIVAPNIITYEKDPNWQWFQDLQNIKDKNLLTGFRPSVFILFKREALIKLAIEYQRSFDIIKNLNSEACLGFLSNKIGLNITEFKDLKINIDWVEINFIKNGKVYHPVKKNINEYKFLNFSKINSDFDQTGKWEFGRNKNQQLLGIVILNNDNSITEYDNFNEKFWEYKNNELLFYNGFGELTTKFKKIQDNIYIGDYYYKDNVARDHHFLIKKS